MQINYFFGPDKLPFALDAQGQVLQMAQLPFHGIVSRGLLSALKQQNIAATIWLHYAPYLEYPSLIKNHDDPNFELLSQLAFNAGVLSFGLSASCASLYVQQNLQALTIGSPLSCDLWQLKEGHTSSVWLVELTDANANQDRFVINVARDQAAGAELKQSSVKMKKIASLCPEINMARVLDITCLSVETENSHYQVVVSKNQYIPASLEIHQPNNNSHYFLVDKFLCKNNQAACISSLYGRELTAKQTQTVNDDIDYFLSQGRNSGIQDLGLNVNDGDLVWNGDNAIVVAIS